MDENRETRFLRTAGLTLFDADRTTPQTCTVNGCPAIRFPNQQRVPTCKHDLDLGEYRGKRPRRCLNRHDPQHDPIPY